MFETPDQVGLTRRVSRRVRADRSLSHTGEPEQGVGFEALAIFISPAR
ncbi:MAG: hypothetical protein ISS51_03500 [Dehalococcoidales bacterium]|nr:hypothetical protein [Dehalococcoidales bacterium]